MSSDEYLHASLSQLVSEIHNFISKLFYQSAALYSFRLPLLLLWLGKAVDGLRTIMNGDTTGLKMYIRELEPLPAQP